MKLQSEICILVMMWIIDSCSADELETDVLRSLNARVTGSSQHPTDTFLLSHATDGSTSTISGSCECCAATQEQFQPWIQINLGRLYRLSKVEVIGRTDWTDTFGGMDIYLHDHKPGVIVQGFTNKTVIPDGVTNQYYSWNLSHRVISQFVTLHLNVFNALLCVCEVNIYSRDCTAGTYGAYCNETCGNCHGGETCDHVTGHCSRCIPGYEMDQCKDDCRAGTFGVDCASTCHCYDNKTCDHVTGDCPDGRCDFGWKGDNCSFECGHGNYGENCLLECGNCLNNETCDRRTGICRHCADGYREHFCKENCLSGHFGVNCSSSCHCLDNVTCDHVNGSCPDNKCDLGWEGGNCSQECESGRFGGNCQLHCGHCYNNDSCDRRDGGCVICAPGYMARKCDQDCSAGTYGLNCNESCGHCLGDEVCDHVTGVCQRCEAGYWGNLCKEDCRPGSFGLNCSSVCNCYDNRTCDHVTGECPDGLCNDGWEGLDCSNACNPGQYGGNCIQTCGHCYDNTTCDRINGTCDTCASGYIGSLCKLACPPGSFGTNCSATCHCYNNTTCHHVMGNCTDNKCDVGWHGDNCSQECSNGTYGELCNATCGHCINNETCHHVTGNCTECDAGYIGQLCADKCPSGLFGFECKSTCHCLNNAICDHVSGNCPGNQCDMGWMGHNCSVGCELGKYGSNCLNDCGHCDQDKPCDRENGACDNCSAGYTGILCTEECRPGTYGQNCSMTCGQCVGDCDFINGVCRSGCLTGYEGIHCEDNYNILKDASVKLSMSSVYQDRDATKAVDDVYMGDPQECRCCSETEHSDISWLQAELGSPMFIKEIIIYGRPDESIVRQLTGFKIYLSMSEMFSEDPVYVHNTALKDNKISVQLPDVAVKFVRIQRAGILIICEIEIFQSDLRCPIYTYGRSCTPCGYCKNGICNQVTGQCPDECDENFEGEMCRTLKIEQSTLMLVIYGGAAGIGIMIVLGLIVACIVCSIKRKQKRSTKHEETSPRVRWSKRQMDEFATLDLPGNK